MPLDPVVEGLLNQMAEAGGAPLSEMAPADARAMYRMMNESSTRATMHEVTDLEAVGVPIRVYRPDADDKQPCLIYFHGGGWVIGDLDTHDHVCRHLAREANCVVVATDYRLAPEYPFPAPLDDCYAVAQWVTANATALNIDPSRIAVGGDSAGANLTACVCLKSKLEAGPALVHQLLMCPVTDSAFDTASYEANAEGYMLTRDSMEWFFNHYLGEGADRFDPLISPVRATDVSGLPAATIITAEFDPLRDEGEAYGAKLQSAGVDTLVRRFPGMIHNFFTMADLLESGGAALSLAAGRLRATFDGA